MNDSAVQSSNSDVLTLNRHYRRPSYIDENQQYRPDIDGLRFLAIAPVLMFHAGIAAIPGGFAGVDVFFVISGYLITKHLVGEAIETGSVSIASFYFRRVRRIAPALFAVLFLSTFFAWLVLFPLDLIRFSESSIASVFFVSNVYFWQQSGYFAAQSDTIPLLHTWSLAIEEQFYLFIPIAIGLLARHLTLMRFLLVAGFAFSLFLSVWQTELRPGVSFYLLPTRAWELLLGSIVACGILPSIMKNRLLATLVGGAGLLMVVASYFVLDEGLPFPGSVALLPCLGAALVIWSGVHHMTPGARLLAWPPFIHLGLLSYSLYLWHWPVIVFYRYIRSEFGAIDIVAVIALTYVLALLTYRYIEKPVRRVQRNRAGALFGGAALSAGAVVGLCAIFIALNGLSERFSDKVLTYAAAVDDRAIVPELCTESKQECQLGTDDPTSFVLVGDSYAGAIAAAVGKVAVEKRLGGFLDHRNACPPLLDYQPDRGSVLDRGACLQRNTQSLRTLIADARIGHVILAASNFRTNDNPKYLSKTIAEIIAGGKHVTVLYGLPFTADNVSLPIALAKAEAFGTRSPTIVRRSETLESMINLYRDNLNVTFVDLAPSLCRDDGCTTDINGHPVFSDGGHLSHYAAHTLMAAFLTGKIFNDRP